MSFRVKRSGVEKSGLRLYHPFRSNPDFHSGFYASLRVSAQPALSAVEWDPDLVSRVGLAPPKNILLNPVLPSKKALKSHLSRFILFLATFPDFRAGRKGSPGRPAIVGTPTGTEFKLCPLKKLTF